ncbi:hypothetical protein EDI_346170 [Entamoeba dispar SAW760]|uniref:Uncharacterized protein n=2 Tax=Entamoeba dispar (strain ATCC PRA-260 / SAW760) TaxID=370354 RepID=B0E686_ENTDS|nr:uncharacterized protein EDI_346170 [Entamoeba dispar SAW760]EDR29971.1 hypothetical protein EDI_346170 [Entamoeba dispar SAW760]|eukprot:EDR29971.1 hypothetical protein EDI_346170 [Entamoeba dispar SAW760]
MEFSSERPNELTLLKRESKTYEAIQQGVIIGLLIINGYSIEINAPSRFAIKSLQLFSINEIYFNSIAMKFGITINVSCELGYEEEMKEKGEMDEKTKKRVIKNTKRRRDINKSAITFNTMVQMVENIGYKITKRSIKSAKKTIQMIKIKEIGIGEEWKMKEERIQEIGSLINQYIKGLITGTGKTIILRNDDQYINSLFIINTEEENKWMNISESTSHEVFLL